MKEKTTPEEHQRINQQKWVVNHSSRTLTDIDTRVLRRGLNFAPSPQKISYMDIAAAVEVVARRLGDEQAASDLRGSVCIILRRATPNLDEDERAALKTLKEDKTSKSSQQIEGTLQW